MKHNLLEICYIIGSVTFILGLKMMGNAKTARKGNLIGANDLIIAAIALANKAILITHNTAEISRVQNLPLEDWEL